MRNQNLLVAAKRLTTVVIAFSAFAAVSQAQTGTPATSDTTRQAGKSASRANERRLALIVKKMSQDAGAKIECDSSVASAMVPQLTEDTTPANFEKQIDTLVTHLPKGTTWAKLYMPDTTAATYKPDDLAAFAMTEARLFGGVGAALPPGTIEVLGQKLTAEKAASVGTALNLKPVYIIANASPQRLSAERRAQALLAMNPEDRSAAIQDMMMQSAEVMKAMFAGMTPEQRQQYMANGQVFKVATPTGGQATIIVRSKSDDAPPEGNPQ